MTYEELRNLVVFCKQEGLMLMADEVWCVVCAHISVCAHARVCRVDSIRHWCACACWRGGRQFLRGATRQVDACVREFGRGPWYAAADARSADVKVYQENIYCDKPFVSLKKVVRDLGECKRKCC